MDGTEEAAEAVAIGECRATVDLEKPNVRRGPGEAGLKQGEHGENWRSGCVCETCGCGII